VGFIRKDLLEAHLFNTTFSHSNVGTKAKLLRAFFFKKKKHEKKEEKKILTIKRERLPRLCQALRFP
jgi:hypothetical protein